MKKQNIYIVTGGGDDKTAKMYLVAANVLTSSFTDSSGGTFHYFVSVADWLSFKSSSQYQKDTDLAYCLASGMVPGQRELIGGAFIIETIS